MSSKNQKLNKNLLLSSMFIYFGMSFMFGYNFGVLNQPVKLIRRFISESYSGRLGHEVKENDHLVTLLWSLINVALFPGGIVGALLVGRISDRLGRKRAMAVVQIFPVLGSLVCVVGVKLLVPELLVIGRFIIGVQNGFATSFGAMFLAEITPVPLRGSFMACHQVFMRVGFLVAALLGLSSVFGSSELWYILILANIVPSITCILGSFYVAESPRFLMLKKNDRAAAVEALKFYRASEDVEDEIEEMLLEDNIRRKEETSEVKYSILRVLRSKELRAPLIIGIMLQIIQQLSGINGMISYSVGIYKNTGLQDNMIEYAVVATNLMFVVGSLIGIPLMDRIGRRSLLIYPMMAMVFTNILMTISLNYKHVSWVPYTSIVFILLFVALFSVGLGGIPLLISAELFRQGPRPHAMSIIGISLWASILFLSTIYEYIQAQLQDQTFILFIFLILCSIYYIYYKVPETKKISFEEISGFFNKDCKSVKLNQISVIEVPSHI